ncbi:serine/threonine-protein kinase KIN2 [Apophysomyces ossiformis]|uniref:non-specific serine/threonine protein kinase n=1 Tax=Apophysomyces ossiformis TaxID=679940 RepID=A0A8H7BSE9_9FUNG|nr:serine/threonine-protein kinase KIN2 [Apophysomyces ossiformis]
MAQPRPVPSVVRKQLQEDNNVSNPQLEVISNYTLGRSLGKGSMGKVKLGTHNVTGEKVAVKIVPRVGPKTTHVKHLAEENNREMRTVREGHVMMLLHHPNIVGLKDLIVIGRYMYIFMDYVDGVQLLTYIVNNKRLTEYRAREIARQVVSALDYMHRNSIVHRDLKVENILINKHGHVKIIDFGLSNLFAPEKKLTTYCGSLYFAAPELLCAQPYRGPEVDIWSLGVVLFVMVTGSVPFDDNNMPAMHEKIKRGHVMYPAYISDSLYHLLRHMFITDPCKRIILADVIRHPWLNMDHDRPVKNYLPLRKPLSFGNLDPDTLKLMTRSFHFGTLTEIQAKLHVILESHLYQSAAQYVADCQTMKHTSLLSEMNYPACYDDPQSVPAAYHPLISVYYLLKERQQRISSSKPDTSPTQILTPRERTLLSSDEMACLVPLISSDQS